MTDDRPRHPKSFLWEPQPDTWNWLSKVVDQICRMDTFCMQLRDRLLSNTGTRLIDWLDHVVVSPQQADDDALRQLGFQHVGDPTVWHHNKGLFPQVVRPTVLDLWRGTEAALGLKVECCEAFLDAHDVTAEMVGDVDGCLRFAKLMDRPLMLVQRMGDAGWHVSTPTDAQRKMVKQARQSFAARQRPRRNSLDGFDDAMRRFSSVADQLGRDWACALFFEAERNYWESRNHAARVQHQRQQQLGMGWANHDHHTYRSSRLDFARLVSLLERMGFHCRERFYAGAEAGWGAQVLEHTPCGLVVFADVDLAPGEIEGDFAHQGLQPRDELGTVGMWCQLHGEAIMSAGMHHLECQFDFDEATRQLASLGIDSMAPFTDFPHLKQAFTEGENWSIDRQHLNTLVDEHVIDSEQAAHFQRHGARGSHLEILERNDGYKGFNQTGISEIIARTDPRRA